MYSMWLRAAGHAEVLHPGDPAELHVDYFNPPLPAALAHDCSEVLDYLARAYGIPRRISKCGPDLSRANICDGVFQIRHFKKGFSKVDDLPSNDCIKTHRVTVFGGCGESGEMLGPRRYVLVEYCVHMKRDYPVEARLEFTFEAPKPAKKPTFEWIKYNEGDQGLPDSGNDLPETIEHLPISLHYPWG